MVPVFILACMTVLAAGYFLYGRVLDRVVRVDDRHITPAAQINDGQDYVPAKAPLLLGQHFSAISAAGPIVGPILACLWFGWLPAVLWILLGSIFIGGLHDYFSLMASVRHRGASIGELVRQYISRNSQMLFLIFVWFALVYVIIAFTDITAQTFRIVTSEGVFGPGVAASSLFYLLAAAVMGVCLYRLKMSLWLATVIFLPVVLFIVWAGPRLPQGVLDALAAIPVKRWDLIILAYCFIASIVPLWILLQPRGYLGGWLLYLTMATALFGGIFGRAAINYPALNLEGLRSALNAAPLFPILFITVACGACSGFHGIVSSGTTSKQLARERDGRVVAYGAMLLEGLVAVLAVATVMVLAQGSSEAKGEPNFIFASGLARYLAMAGIPFSMALGFMLLAFSTFVYDTLDVCTRLARYIFQELTGWKTYAGGVGATLATLALPAIFLISTKEKGYLIAWPIFGTTNQLLAGLTLLAVTVWLARTGRPFVFALAPMCVMMLFSMWSLVLQILPVFRQGFSGKPETAIIGVVGILLFSLALWLAAEAATVMWRCRKEARAGRSACRRDA